MRIVAGKFRRRILRTNPGLTTRPITDRTKEMLFENLGGELKGERVADIFAGTGTIGLEALSRGAASVVFVEKDFKAHELLVENVEMLGVQEVTLCWKTDVLRCSFRPKNADALWPYDLVFFDPPYNLVADVQPGSPLFKSLERLGKPDVTADGARLVFRTPEKPRFTMPDCWEPAWELEASTMEIHVYRRKPQPLEPQLPGEPPSEPEPETE